MSCITGPHLPPLDQIDGLSLLLGDTSIDPPDLNSKLCCEISLVTPPIPVPIGTVLKTFLTDPTGTGATTLDSALALIQTTEDQLNDLLDGLTFDCPLD